MYKKRLVHWLRHVIVAGMVTGKHACLCKAQETTGNAGTTYYVDAENGDDSNSGTSIDAPWKSLNKVTDTTFLPGRPNSVKIRQCVEWGMVMAERLRCGRSADYY